mgnify:CR=1 FL=1
MPQRSAFDRQVGHVDLVRKRKIPPVAADGAEFDAHIHGACAATRQHAAFRFEDERILAGFFHQQMGNAARGIAAGRHLAAVDVEDAHACERAGRRCLGRRAFDGQKLVAADPHLRIADPDDVGAREGAAIGPPVEDDEMVAQAVHLDEGPLGTCPGIVLTIHRHKPAYAISRICPAKPSPRGGGTVSSPVRIAYTLWLRRSMPRWRRPIAPSGRT